MEAGCAKHIRNMILRRAMVPDEIEGGSNLGNHISFRIFHQGIQPRVLQRLTPKMARKFWSSN